MPKDLVDMASFDADISVPINGDVRSAFTVEPAFQALANRTRYLLDRVTSAATGNKIIIPLVAAKASRFDFGVAAESSSNSDRGTWWQSDITDAGYLWIPIPHILGASITALTARVHGDFATNGPRPALPATMPKLTLWRSDGSAATSVASQTDSSADVPSYEAAHTIAITGINEAFSADNTLWIEFNGEFDAGANDLADALALFRITAAIQ